MDKLINIETLNKSRSMINVGIAGEEIKPGLFRTVLLARNGIFEVNKGSWMGTCTKKIDKFVLSESASIPELEDTYSLSEELGSKLPLEAFSAAYKFYKEVEDLNGNEAQINFYINNKNVETITVENETLVLKDIPGIQFWTDEVFSYVPIQTNHGAVTSTDDPIYTEIRRVTLPFIETHSHNSMAAFKSGTDKANSHIEGLQLVFGKLNAKDTYDFKSWVTISGHQFDDLPHEELSKFIEMPAEIGKVEDLLIDEVEVPKEWFTQCTWATQTPRYVNTRPVGVQHGSRLGKSYKRYTSPLDAARQDSQSFWDEWDAEFYEPKPSELAKSTEYINEYFDDYYGEITGGYDGIVDTFDNTSAHPDAVSIETDDYLIQHIEGKDTADIPYMYSKQYMDDYIDLLEEDARDVEKAQEYEERNKLAVANLKSLNEKNQKPVEVEPVLTGIEQIKSAVKKNTKANETQKAEVTHKSVSKIEAEQNVKQMKEMVEEIKHEKKDTHESWFSRIFR